MQGNGTSECSDCLESKDRFPCARIDVVLLGPVAKDHDSGNYVFDGKKCVEVKHFPVAVSQINGFFKSGHLWCSFCLEADKESCYRYCGKLGTHSALFLSVPTFG